MLRSRWLTLLLTASMLSACAGNTPPITPPPPDPTLRLGEPGAAAEPATPAEYDLMIENGRVVDGTGSAWFYGDIAVKDGRIARIVPKGVLRGTSASERIDAYGHVVSPGFIDIQSQSRYAFLDGDSRVVSKVTQGVLITDCISSETASLRRALSRCGRGATLRARRVRNSRRGV